MIGLCVISKSTSAPSNSRDRAPTDGPSRHPTRALDPNATDRIARSVWSFTRIALVLVIAGQSLGRSEAAAQEPIDEPVQDEQFSASSVTPTPEMWLYQQEIMRQQDPSVAVRQRAEFVANQRRRRLASQRWLGYSKLRPMVSPTPWLSTWSPRWSGSTGRVYVWTSTPTAQTTPHESRYDR